MLIVDDFINKRYSLKNLSDADFDSIVECLAEQLVHKSFYVNYEENILRKDWKKLLEWKSNDDHINSTSRLGMKLCEHFFPNFYDIENNKGESFVSMWNKDNLIKILKWNRKSHSTPYMSELKRGIYFCCGMTKSTMFRPQLAKLICMHYTPSIVLDPCAGWGGRMLGVVSSGARYIAFEPNTKTHNNLKELAAFLKIESQVEIICDSALNMDNYNIPKVDLVLTSPPYFDLEVYTHEETQSVSNHSSYDSWKTGFFIPLMQKSVSKLTENGISCWNVGKVGKNNMRDDVIAFHENRGYNKLNTVSVISSKRQALQNDHRNEKSYDITDIFSKNYTRNTLMEHFNG